MRSAPPALALALALSLSGCGEGPPAGTVIVFPASSVGAEAEVLERQVERFQRIHPDVHVELRATPDAADQRHQLYVQWLNAGASEPDILQLDVVWTPEFAAAGWVLPLDRFAPDLDDFVPAAVQANRWQGRTWALAWFVDVGMLYWRKDLMRAPPTSFSQLTASARRGIKEAGLPYGFVWQGARYEGLVTVFLEYLGGFGGSILDASERVVVDSPEAARALEAMRDSIHLEGVAPQAVLAWHEEEVRFAFSNGQAVFMRNWPYAAALAADTEHSRVAGRFGVAPMPATPEGRPTSALGGQQLAINARSRHPEAAWTLIDYLTRPEQMLERAQLAGQWPARLEVYDDPRLADALPVSPSDARRLMESARPRPVTPIYTQLSEILQVRLHRALTRQQEPAAALAEAATAMRQALAEAASRDE